MLGLPGDSQLWGAPDAHSQHLRVNMGTFSGTLRIRLCPGPSHPLGKESPALSQASRCSGQAQPVRVPEEASPPGSRAVHTQGESLPAHRAADYRQHQDPASAAALLAGRGVAPAPTMLQTAGRPWWGLPLGRLGTRLDLPRPSCGHTTAGPLQEDDHPHLVLTLK